MNEGVSVLDDSRCDLHYTKYVENSERTRTIRKVIEGFEVIDHIEPIALDHPALLKVHKPKYIEKIVNACKNEELKLLEMDVMVYGQDSLNAIRIAANSGIIAVDMPGSVFCNVRPPGHHAESGKAKGFCIFNNIAIAAQYALDKGLRVLIFDWDVHHGNGTHNFVKDKKNILFINTQEKGIYPGTGKSRRKGNIYSYNLNPGDGDEEMMHLFNTYIISDIEGFKPDIILISCGFDAHTLDPLSNLNLSSKMYGWMTRELKKLCPKIVSILEGGYNLIALEESVREHLINLK